MKRFYSASVQNNIALLEGSEKEHCIKVLRTQIGETVEVVDGKGNVFEGQLSSSEKLTATLTIIKKLAIQAILPAISVGICIPKNPSRWEWFLEKSTEIGVNKIMPIISKRSEKPTIRKDRNEQIILAAFKQAGQLYLPQLAQPIAFEKFIQTSEFNFAKKFIAHCEENERTFLADKYKKGEEAIVLIGPEGDFTSEEIKLAVQKGFEPISLGNSRLRVETAGVVAVGMINWLNY
jgi:16S rRNA (uracil1498-N3)-methyltransferase